MTVVGFRIVYIGIIIIFLFFKYSTQYLHFNIQDDDLCSLIKKRKILLGRDNFSAIIIKQSRLNDHSIDWQNNFFCKFQINTPHSKEGLLAVLQLLSFRKNETTDSCIDYIQFRKKDGSTSAKYCGHFNAALKMDRTFVSPTEVITKGNAFVDEFGQLDVEIFVSKEALRPEEEMDLTLVITAYRHCIEVLLKNNNYRPCGASKHKRDYCINYNFFHDGFINCPFADCVDEDGCSNHVPEINNKPSIENKVLIGFISSSFIIFTMFIMCIWFCRATKIFCWSNNFAHPTPPESSRSIPLSSAPRLIEMNEQAISTIPDSRENNSSNERAIEEDKDLPPSYDSLFPQR